MFLTHNESNDPVALFTDTRDNADMLYLVMDERMFSDTLLRVVKLGPWSYVVYDVAVLNGKPIHETHSYRQRQEMIASLLEAFHFPDLVALWMPSEVPLWDTPIRGYEYYDDAPGTVGVFCPVKE